jgi:menaquinone-dependent protoporphyrinogen oxidase
MANVIVVYGTTEGQTAKIAQHIADAGRGLGHHVEVVHAAELGERTDLGAYGAAVVGASLHEGRYQRSIVNFVKAQHAWLAAHPTAFFSVSLGAASSDPSERAEVERISAEFIAGCDFRPRVVASLAGALKYTQYNWLKRALLRHISSREGGPTDVAQDYELTDWSEVDRFAHGFFVDQLG